MDKIERQKSFVEVAEGSDFPIQNLPYGVFSPLQKKNIFQVLKKNTCVQNIKNFSQMSF